MPYIVPSVYFSFECRICTEVRSTYLLYAVILARMMEPLNQHGTSIHSASYPARLSSSASINKIKNNYNLLNPLNPVIFGAADRLRSPLSLPRNTTSTSPTSSPCLINHNRIRIPATLPRTIQECLYTMSQTRTMSMSREKSIDSSCSHVHVPAKSRRSTRGDCPPICGRHAGTRNPDCYALLS